MEVEFQDPDLDALETEPGIPPGLDPARVKAFRKRIQAIRAAADERDLYAMRGWRTERLQGDRSHQYSMRLNDQWRLIFEIRKGNPGNVIVVVAIEDYH